MFLLRFSRLKSDVYAIIPNAKNFKSQIHSPYCTIILFSFTRIPLPYHFCHDLESVSSEVVGEWLSAEPHQHPRVEIPGLGLECGDWKGALRIIIRLA